MSAQSILQRVTLEPPHQVVTPGDVAIVTLVLDGDRGGRTGLPARIHYDSSKLTLESTQLLFSVGHLAAQDMAEAGSRHSDGDSATDRLVVAGWSSFLGSWPGAAAFPLELLSLSFRTQPGFMSTELHVTLIEVCPGCISELAGATIEESPIVIPTTSRVGLLLLAAALAAIAIAVLLRTR